MRKRRNVTLQKKREKKDLFRKKTRAAKWESGPGTEDKKSFSC